MDDLAAEQSIPANYLVQILIELKSQGLVRSLRGKEGGYLLGRSPSQITLADVLRASQGCVFDSPALVDPECPAELKRAWEQLRDTMEAAAGGITFQQLLENGADREKMYYI